MYISYQNKRSVAIYNLPEQGKDSVEVPNLINSIVSSAEIAMMQRIRKFAKTNSQSRPLQLVFKKSC